MKNFLTFFVMLIFYQVHAQDMQWYVLNKCYMTNPGQHSSAQTSDRKCNIYEVEHPFRPAPLPYNEPARNDLFIIFDNGYHFNSRYLELENNNNMGWDDWTSNNFSGYFLETNVNISHLYFTNVYEGNEEPDAYLAPGQISPSNSGNIFKFNGSPIISPNSPSRTITTNHTPVPGKDLTLIIAHDSLDKECTYDLCYYIEPILEEKRQSSINAFSPSNIFGIGTALNSFVATGDGSTLMPEPYTFDGTETNCIKNLQLNTTGGFTYFNLKLREDPDSILSNSPIYFSLSSPDCPDIVSPRDTIKNSHDPNYVQVLCVSKPDTIPISTIHYRAQCMNDGEADQPDPSIELTFPFPVSPSDIIVTSARIRSSLNYNIFNEQSPKVCSVGTNRIKFQFCGNLAFCPIPTEEDSCTAWVEFCVKVDSNDVNVLTGVIRPFDRNTNFGDDPYIIERYEGLDCDSIFIPADTTGGTIGNDDPNFESEEENNFQDNPKDEELESSEELVNGTWICVRENSNCDCTSEVTICPIYKIICDGTLNWIALIAYIIIILILLWLLSNYFRKRSKG